jgi:hypothetical protein
VGAGARDECDAEDNRARVRLMLRGGIICESLKPGTTLEGYDLKIVRWSRYEVTGTTEWQPPIWTLIEFEAPDDESDALALRLSKDLALRGWYANWNSDTQAVVVFPDKVFRYKRGDEKGRAKAQQYGRDCGVPEPQLDWDD